MLNTIPTDMLYHISTFLKFKEMINVVQTHRIPKCLDSHIRQKQFKWLQKKVAEHFIHNILSRTLCRRYM